MKKLRRSIIISVTNDLVHDQRMIRTCNTLYNVGYDVMLLGHKKAGSTPLSQQPWSQERIYTLFRKGPLFYAGFNIRLFLRLMFARADIMVAVDLDTILATSLASWLKGRKMVYDAHEFFTEVPELAGRKRVKGIWATIGRVCVPRADLCYTVSGSLSRILSEKYKREFHVIMNVPLFQLRSENIVPVKRFVLFYQGALNPGRGLEECIEALQGSDAHIRIAGDGPIKAGLVKMVREKGLTDRVEFLGWLGADDLARETAAASAGLNILDDSSLSYKYSLANKFFNYIHAGIPQICADLPEYRAINEKWEVAVLCRNNSRDIETAIKKLADDASYFDRLRNNCYDAARHLNWQHEEKRLIALYNGI